MNLVAPGGAKGPRLQACPACPSCCQRRGEAGCAAGAGRLAAQPCPGAGGGYVPDPRLGIKCLLPGPLQQTPAFPRIISLITMPADFTSQLIFLPFVSNSNTLPFSQDFQESSSQRPFCGERGGREMSPEGEQYLSLSLKKEKKKMKERALSAKSPRFGIKCYLKFRTNSRLSC